MSSKRRVRRRRCSQKRRYESAPAAAASLRKLLQIGRVHEGSECYHCKFCNGWHIGRGKQDRPGSKRKAWQWLGQQI